MAAERVVEFERGVPRLRELVLMLSHHIPKKDISGNTPLLEGFLVEKDMHMEYVDSAYKLLEIFGNTSEREHALEFVEAIEEEPFPVDPDSYRKILHELTTQAIVLLESPISYSTDPSLIAFDEKSKRHELPLERFVDVFEHFFEIQTLLGDPIVGLETYVQFLENQKKLGFSYNRSKAVLKQQVNCLDQLISLYPEGEMKNEAVANALTARKDLADVLLTVENAEGLEMYKKALEFADQNVICSNNPLFYKTLGSIHHDLASYEWGVRDIFSKEVQRHLALSADYYDLAVQAEIERGVRLFQESEIESIVGSEKSGAKSGTKDDVKDKSGNAEGENTIDTDELAQIPVLRADEISSDELLAECYRGKAHTLYSIAKGTSGFDKMHYLYAAYEAVEQAKRLQVHDESTSKLLADVYFDTWQVTGNSTIGQEARFQALELYMGLKESYLEEAARKIEQLEKDPNIDGYDDSDGDDFWKQD